MDKKSMGNGNGGGKSAGLLKSDGTPFRVDGWQNLLSGLGTSSDKTLFNKFGTLKVMQDSELARVYVGDGWARKIVDAPADDMTRAGISIDGDEDEKYSKEMRRISALAKINLAVKWTRLYRGSLVIVGVDGGGELNTPLIRASKITSLTVLPPSRVRLTAESINTDPSSPYFQDVEIFPVTTKAGEHLDVHASRCLIFKGDPIPDDVTLATELSGTDYQYWGVSALQAVNEKLGNYSGMEQHISNLIYEMIIGVYKFENLAELLEQNDVQAIQTRISVINQTKSMINSVFLGAGEEFGRNTASVAGLADLWDRMMMMLSGVSGIPVTRLFGRSPAGMNATGESDLRNYYDTIRADQQNWLYNPVAKLLSIMALTFGQKEEMSFTFNDPWSPTQEQMVEMRKKQAETDEIYINTQVLAPEEVTTSRFEGGYSFDTELQAGIDRTEVEE